MYKRHILYLIFFTLLFLLVSYFIDFSISESLMQNFVTFLSITFGFYMTSISVLYNSKYLKKLHDEIDAEKPIQRKIHTLQIYFTNSALWSLFSIGTLIFYSLTVKVDKGILSINPFFEDLLLLIVMVNFILMVLLFKIFMNGFIEEAKS